MPAKAIRVAYRYLQSGILQAPPAMVEAIHKWVQEVVAAREHSRLLDELPAAREGDKRVREEHAKWLQAHAAWKAAPTAWKAHKAYHEASWVLGYPPRRWKIQRFQKLTPEKREALIEAVNAKLDADMDEYNARYPNGPGGREEHVLEEIAELQPYLGVGKVKGDVDYERKFDIDLTGSKYSDLEDRAAERVRAEAKRMLEVIDKNSRGKEMTPDQQKFVDEMVEDLENQIRTGKSSWKRIFVILDPSGRAGKRYSGEWRSLPPQLTIVLPSYFTVAGSDLRTIIRHELQHFMQDYIAHLVAGSLPKLRAGLPSRGIRTPDYKQHYDPQSRFFDKDKVRDLFRRLRQQGINPRRLDWHSLDDVEFYTKLADAIEQFENVQRHIEPELMRAAIRRFVGGKVPKEHAEAVQWKVTPSRYFLALKRRAPGKWKKAVGEFIKAVL
jgi:hypothetical protein